MADLYPSERVLWTGAPMRVPVFEPADRVMIPFITVWTGLATVGFPSALAHASGGSVFAGVFVVFGLYMLVGRLIVRYVALRSSRYTVTDLRLIVTMRVFGRPREFTEYLRELKPPTLRESRDGLGTIRFGGSGRLEMGRYAARSQIGDPLVLHGVQHVHHVRDIIAAAQIEAFRA